MSYEKTYGKPVDPLSFKKAIVDDLRAAVTKAEDKARRYLKEADIEVDACYICGSKERSEPVAEMYGFQYVRCLNCTHVYQTKRLSLDVLTRMYEEDAGYASTYTDEKQIKYRMENITKPLVEFIMKYVNKPSGKWLDVGCGIGDLVSYVETREAEKSRWQAVGIDVSRDCVETGSRIFDIDIRMQTLRQFAAENPDAKFDVVSFLGYLDLTPEPMKDLALGRDLLNENGYVVMRGPNHDSVSSLVQKAMPDLAVRHLIPPHSIQQWTVKSAETALKLTGFEPLAIWYLGLDFYEFLNTLCLVIDGFQKSELYKFFMDNFNDFEKVIDEKEMSDKFMMIGRKGG